MNRSTMREQAFKLIYSMEIMKTKELDEQIKLFFESNSIENQDAQKYIQDALLGIEKNKETIETLIEKNLKKDWKMERISKVDLCILKLAIYEIKYKEIPFKVVINEAVELAKKYGEDNSKVFVKWNISKYCKLVKKKEA